jgi:hypothetical protein
MQEKKYLQILREVASQYQIEVRTFRDNTLIHLQKDTYQKFIYGYQFELNSDSVSAICKDKGAISIILDFHQVPHVEHRMFSRPSLNALTSESLWTSIQNFSQKYNFDIVCKPNYGFSGKDVYHTRHQRELEEVVHKLLSIYSEFCISPFYDVEFEYRVIVLNGHSKLIYYKKRHALIGDGHSSLKILLLNYVSSLSTQDTTKFFKDFDCSILTSDRVLAYGEKFDLKWKHNLGQAAIANLYNIDQRKKEQISNLALQTACALNLSFASIDIFEVEDEFKVLEAHTAVAMDTFVRHYGEEGYQIAKEIYDKVIRCMFDID